MFRKTIYAIIALTISLTISSCESSSISEESTADNYTESDDSIFNYTDNSTFDDYSYDDFYDYEYEDSEYYDEPNYDYLYDMGFNNFYGYTNWVKITRYNLDNATVAYEGKTISGVVFDNGYFTELEFEVKNEQLYEKNDTHSFSYIFNLTSNDAIQYDRRGINKRDWIITDRVVDELKGIVILKTQNLYSEEWYIPADFIDWSRSPEILEKDGKTYNCYYLISN